MRYLAIVLLVIALLPAETASQIPPVPPSPPSPPRSDLGKWWKNSEVVRELGLTDVQVGQIEQTFLEHRLKLIDLRAELERQEARLQPLIEDPRPDEAKVGAQIDLVLAARGKLEKANTMMMLAIRRVLTVEQWRKLQELQERHTPPPPPPPPPPPGAASRAEEDVVYRIGGRVQPPKLMQQPLPPYTQEARDAKIEGIVLLQGIVRKDGTIDRLKVLRGLGHGLDQSAIDTVRNRWRFKPGTLDGLPVNVDANIEISFRLQ